MKVMASGRTLRRTPQTPPLTVLIPTFNEEQHIESKVQNLLKCDYPMDRLRILVIDNGSTDRTLEIARSLPVEILEADRGKVHAINRGLRAVDTAYVVVTDADIHLEKSALRRAVSLLGDEVGAVSGVPLLKPCDSKAQRIKQKQIQGESLLRHLESLCHSSCTLDGRLMVFHVEPGFQLPPETTADDYEMTFLTIAKGKRAVVDMEARVFEQRPSTFLSDIQQIRRWFKQGFLTSWRYRSFLWNPRYACFGCWTFPFRRFFIYYIPLYFLVFLFYACFWIKAWVFLPILGIAGFLLATRRYYSLALYLGILLMWYDLLLDRGKKHRYTMGRWSR